jgi:hypothetical protein
MSGSVFALAGTFNCSCKLHKAIGGQNITDLLCLALLRCSSYCVLYNPGVEGHTQATSPTHTD